MVIGENVEDPTRPPVLAMAGANSPGEDRIDMRDDEIVGMESADSVAPGEDWESRRAGLIRRFRS